MTRAEAVAAIKLRLGFYSKKDSEIENELRIAQDAMETEGIKLEAKGIFRPWFLITEMMDAVTVVNEERVAFPTGFLGEVEDAALWILDPDEDDDTAWKELAKDSLDFLIQNYPGRKLPQTYANMGHYFRLKPIPDAAYPLKIIAYAKDAVLTTDTPNLWLTHAPRTLWSKAGIEMATALHDAVALKQFSSIFVESSLALFTTSEERLHTNRRYVMGGQD